MTKKTVETIEGMTEIIATLKKDSADMGADEMAFYLGAAIEAAEEFAARENLRSRTRNTSATAE
jgi:hypothetical protein